MAAVYQDPMKKDEDSAAPPGGRPETPMRPLTAREKLFYNNFDELSKLRQQVYGKLNIFPGNTFLPVRPAAMPVDADQGESSVAMTTADFLPLKEQNPQANGLSGNCKAKQKKKKKGKKFRQPVKKQELAQDPFSILQRQQQNLQSGFHHDNTHGGQEVTIVHDHHRPWEHPTMRPKPEDDISTAAATSGCLGEQENVAILPRHNATLGKLSDSNWEEVVPYPGLKQDLDLDGFLSDDSDLEMDIMT